MINRLLFDEDGIILYGWVIAAIAVSFVLIPLFCYLILG